MLPQTRDCQGRPCQWMPHQPACAVAAGDVHSTLPCSWWWWAVLEHLSRAKAAILAMVTAQAHTNAHPELPREASTWANRMQAQAASRAVHLAQRLHPASTTHPGILHPALYQTFNQGVPATAGRPRPGRWQHQERRVAGCRRPGLQRHIRWQGLAQSARGSSCPPGPGWWHPQMWQSRTPAHAAHGQAPWCDVSSHGAVRLDPWHENSGPSNC